MKRRKYIRSRHGQKSRLQRIEQLLMPHRSELPEEEEICDEEWLGHFRLYGKNGFFRHEPDFPQALREFEEALQQAKQDPHYLPPPEFMPHASEVRRRRYWRLDTMSVAVQESWLWLTAMYCRVMDGIPAVSLQEWDMLITWYHAHRQEMARWTIQAVDREMTISCLDQALEQTTARDVEAGKYAAILRQLYARFHRRPHASLSAGSQASSDSPSQELFPAGGGWYRIFVLIQKRFRWNDNGALNDAIERFRVVIETAKKQSPRRESLHDVEVSKQQWLVSQLLLRLLKAETPQS